MERSERKRLFVTRIHKQFQCDTFIPDIDSEKFKLLPEWVRFFISAFFTKSKLHEPQLVQICHLNFAYRFPGVPTGLQEESGLQYEFQVYESVER